ncbi:hypothetical protein Micbo1qcDRAFT_162515 [Microdochium bolleyi]|uniref:Uncharacterized protein n=1 Tax=Microdochium bolleyi TaxID=196109 RepID=A0A136J552_9PEZI|nr:hypothetical protein Micbo1qcDRAFT_162515 [Microdochium bolleyi]
MGSVKVQDVKAARLSLRMPSDSRKFWATSARRLRLNVYDDEEMLPEIKLSKDAKPQDEEQSELVEDGEESRDSSEEAEQDRTDTEDEHGEYNVEDAEGETTHDDGLSFLSYDRVEEVLGFPRDASFIESSDDSSSDEEDLGDSVNEAEPVESDEASLPQRAHPNENKDSDSDHINLQPKMKSSQLGTATAVASSSPPPPIKLEPSTDDPAVELDLLEAIHHSAFDFAGTTRARETLRAKIAAEHRLQSEADSLDMASSRAEQARLWAMLREEEMPDDLAPALQEGRAESRMSSVAPSTDDEGFTTDATTTNGKKKNRRIATLEGSGGGTGGIGGGTSDWRAKTEYYSEWELEWRQRHMR